jgi:carbonic anhydrase/acetyltransferase-like protein (isoleucine patch superfamily)
MAIYAIDGKNPRIHPEAYVHPDAVVIGDVTIGAESTVWPGAVLRGDYGTITIGARTSVQDGTVIHATAQVSTTVGDGCVIGHLAHLEGCVLENDCLVGSGSVVLHRAVIGYGATVGANAVVTNDMTVPAEALAVGVPALIKEGRSSVAFNQGAAALYVANGKRYGATLVRLDPIE